METVRFSRFTPAALAVVATAFAATLAAAQATTTSAGEVANFAQKHLIDQMIVGDSIEVEMAQLATSRTQNAAVKAFANQLVADHKAHLQQLGQLAAKPDLGREANPADASASHFAGQLASLESMTPDSGFDRRFVQDQIENHQAAINSLKASRSAATDADVQHEIDAELPVLEKHLSAAQRLASQLAAPSGAAPQTPETAAKKADSTSQKADTAAKKIDGATPKPDSSAAKPPAAKPPVAKPPV